YLTAKALQMAQDQGLDLVEVSPNAKPPVCKIMDYGKHKYELAKKQKEARKHQVVVVTKELKFRPTTDDHDFEFKVRNARKFLEHGNKVKLSLRFRGREMAHRELGMELLKRIFEKLKDIAQIEAEAKMEGRQLMMMVGPLKKK
ncbi:MAG: translation initiation factor IF-3, partial [Deltaproteobacteria bacterium]|nr:translation initiation factor IF-3 [Deltaproteobacteria bacterium]